MKAATLAYPRPKRRVDPVETLVEASAVVAQYSLEVDQLLRALSELIRKVVDCQLFAVLLRSQGQTLRIRYAIGYRAETIRNLRVSVGEGITGGAAASLKTVRVNDVRMDPRYLLAVDAVRSEIAVPLVARGRLVGVIDIQSPVPNAFGDYEQKMLELIASRFSLAIDGARLYRATLRQNRTLRTLSDIAREFSHILDPEELLRKISNLVHKVIPYDAFSIYLVEETRQRLRNYFVIRHDERAEWQHLPLGRGIIGAAAESGRPVLVRDTENDPRYVAAMEGIRSEVAVPLVLQERVMGVLDLESHRVGAFTNDHVRILSLLAPQVASAIENARLYKRVSLNEERLGNDLRAARELQRYLLPTTLPDLPGLELAARNDPASEVSGDLYDFFRFRDGSAGILLGDVSGKGAAAALYGALVQGLIRKLIEEVQSPSDLLAAANDALLSRRIQARYLTAVYAQWQPKTRTVRLVNGGQPWPVLRRGGKAELVSISGLPLGLLDSAGHESVDIHLEPDDALVIASDGITESENRAGDPYGDERLRQVVEAHPAAPAQHLMDAIFEDVARYTAGGKIVDDRTAIVLRATE